LAQTHLPVDDAEMIAFWAISTWFQPYLGIRPCLVITGAALDAEVVLGLLGKFCPRAALLAGFKRGDLGVLRWACKTNLVWEPNLDKRTAALLSSLTVRDCLVVEGGSLTSCSKSTAIYAGEIPAIHKIRHSICVHITATNAALPAAPQHLQKTIERIPVHLEQYREKNLDYISHWQFVPSGLPSETAAIAKVIGSCIVDAPALRQKLVALLKTQDRQQLSQRSGATEAVVVEAVLLLSRQDRGHAFASEIGDEANRLRELRGERQKLSPETVGRQLSKLGLRTHRLTSAGNGLTFDKATIALIQQLAAVHVEDDLLAEAENLHGSQVTENKNVVEVM
jgi:hypothetical protein